LVRFLFFVSRTRDKKKPPFIRKAAFRLGDFVQIKITDPRIGQEIGFSAKPP